MTAILMNTGVRVNAIPIKTHYGLGVPGFEPRCGRGVALTTNLF
jgi:hypothetical protein